MKTYVQPKYLIERDQDRCIRCKVCVNQCSYDTHYYDEEEDILYLAKQGQEEEVVEVAPGINVEFDKGGQLIGVELLNASALLKDVIKPIEKKIALA